MQKLYNDAEVFSKFDWFKKWCHFWNDQLTLHSVTWLLHKGYTIGYFKMVIIWLTFTRMVMSTTMHLKTLTFSEKCYVIWKQWWNSFTQDLQIFQTCKKWIIFRFSSLLSKWLKRTKKFSNSLNIKTDLFSFFSDVYFLSDIHLRFRFSLQWNISRINTGR